MIQAPEWSLEWRKSFATFSANATGLPPLDGAQKGHLLRCVLVLVGVCAEITHNVGNEA